MYEPMNVTSHGLLSGNIEGQPYVLASWYGFSIELLLVSVPAYTPHAWTVEN